MKLTRTKKVALAVVAIITGLIMFWSTSFDTMPTVLSKAYLVVGIGLVGIGLLLGIDIDHDS